jgi:uncharacterized protein (TIGR03435 family)
VNAARRSACATTCLFLGMAPMLAQAPLAFEVASVKPAVDGIKGVKGSCHGVDSIYAPNQKADAPSPGRCEIANARLSHLINIAWDLRSMALLKSGPDWIARGDERFNVLAKAEEPGKATEEQLLTMLQTLLIDRFQLKFHRETTEMPGFALVRAKNGTKLRESKSQEVGITLGGGTGAIKKPTPGRPISFKARRYSMAMLVNLLSRVAERGPGIDKTGLEGVYDFTLSWMRTPAHRSLRRCGNNWVFAWNRRRSRYRSSSSIRRNGRPRIDGARSCLTRIQK